MTAIECPHCGGAVNVPDEEILNTAKLGNAGVPVTHQDPRKEFMDLIEYFEENHFWDAEVFYKLTQWGVRVPYGPRLKIRERIIEFLVMAPPGEWKWKKIEDLREILEVYLK